MTHKERNYCSALDQVVHMFFHKDTIFGLDVAFNKPTLEELESEIEEEYTARDRAIDENNYEEDHA